MQHLRFLVGTNLLSFPALYDNGAFGNIIVNAAQHGRDCARVNGMHLEVLKKMTNSENIVYSAVVSKVRQAMDSIQLHR